MSRTTRFNPLADRTFAERSFQSLKALRNAAHATTRNDKVVVVTIAHTAEALTFALMDIADMVAEVITTLHRIESQLEQSGTTEE